MIFMKLRIIAGILISCLCLLIAGFAYADEAVEVDDSKAKETLDKYRVIDTSLYDGETYITRNDGLSIILRAIGTTENVWYESYGSKGPIYSDEDFPDNVSGEEYIKTIYGDNSKFNTAEGYGYYWADYITYAIRFDTGIVYGDDRTEDGVITFRFPRPITTNEALAFMVRCLDNRDIDMDIYNLEDTFMRAEELGLIKETDAFYSDPDDQIAPDDFFVLVNRFIHQKRYLYFDREKGYDYWHDWEGSTTYIEYLADSMCIAESADTVYLGKKGYMNTAEHLCGCME